MDVYGTDIFKALFSPFRVSFMNNQKQQKPTLSGQRFKTRKRGKYLYSNNIFFSDLQNNLYFGSSGRLLLIIKT